METLLRACILVTLAVTALGDSAPTDHHDAANNSKTFINTISAVTFIGNDGNLLRCSQDPDDCEVFHETGDHQIYSLHINGEYIYAGLDNGVILKCHLYTKNSCDNFYSGSGEVWSLASGRRRLFAGLADGTILSCDEQPLAKASCKPLYNVKYSVNSLIQTDTTLYAGLASGDVMRCSLSGVENCTEIYEADAGVSGIAIMGKYLYVLTNEGTLSKCSNISELAAADCVSVNSKINTGDFWDLRAFNESLYVYGNDVGICKLVDDTSCESFINSLSTWSFTMAYRTHKLQNEYKDEHVSCKKPGPQCQLVHYFGEGEIAGFEVYVKDGKIFDANDTLEVTSDADQGHAGPAAVFAMAPDGRLLLAKYHHRGYLLQTSSLLAGGPVSGAGEIIVEQGVIKKIVACSDQYKVDLELNNQVVKSLHTQGYTDPIVSEVCPEGEKH